MKYIFGRSLQVAIFSVIGVLAGCDLEKVVIGQGTLTTDPESPQACQTPSSTCTAFPENSTVVVTAAPDEGWAFAGWEGTCPQVDVVHVERCTLFMDEHKSVTARFVPISAGSFTAGNWYVGRNSYTQYRAGNMPLVLVVSHGGEQVPGEIPNRVPSAQYPNVRTSNDTNSRLLADALANQMLEYSGRLPHIVINDLNRIKLDANRDIGEAALGNVFAERAWGEFHGFITASRSDVAQQFNQGLVIDVHGYTDNDNPESGLVQLGFLITNAQLRHDPSQPQNTITNEMFDQNVSYVQNSSIRHLQARTGLTFSNLLRGFDSIGHVFEYAGLPAVPSPITLHTDPGYSFYGGGYITETHGSKNGGSVDAIQFEFPRHLRDTDPEAIDTGETTAAILYNYMLTHYPF